MSAVFSIQNHGANPDGVTLNTVAFQSAIDACHDAGGGVVHCGPGTFLTGPIRLKSNVELHVGAGCRIVGSPDPDHYQPLISDGFHHAFAPENTADYLIGAQHAHNIAITGPGEINASGPAFYDASAGLGGSGKFASGKPARRPRLLMLHCCTDVRIEDTAFVDSPCWTFWLMRCERVGIHRIKIRGDRRMINNDGIDLDGCRDVVVSNCFIQTEDDSIVVRAIQKVHAEPVVCENITITNCVLESTCQCIRISCPSDHITRNCVFSNLVLNSRSNGINFDFPNRYLSAGSEGSADVSDMTFSNLVINCKACPIRIEVQPGIKLKRVSGITFSGIRTRSVFPCIIKGNAETIIEDITFNNMRIENTGEQAICCSHCRGVKMQNVELVNLPQSDA